VRRGAGAAYCAGGWHGGTLFAAAREIDPIDQVLLIKTVRGRAHRPAGSMAGSLSISQKPCALVRNNLF
jgi:hypothetical protein